MDKKKELLWRAYIVMLMFVIASLVIMFKIFKISVIEGDRWRAKASDNIKWRIVDADRGSIYSDEMHLLSTSVQFFEIRMDLATVKDKLFYENVDSLAIFLNGFSKEYIKEKSVSQWKNELLANKKKKNAYFYIARGLDIDAFNKIKKAPILKYGKYKGGLIAFRYGRRVKPFRDMASRTIGVDRENADRIGLEGYFDRFLKGDADQRLMKKLSSPDGEIWVPLYDPSENDIRKGDDLVTTLNIEIQDFVHHSMMDMLQKYDAEGGSAIVMETKTGAIKAITNLGKSADGSYVEMYNHGVARLSEPGSTMKLATVLALMEDGYATAESKVNLNYGSKRCSDRIMFDSEKHNRSIVTMSEAFEISSNVGIASLANDAYNSIDGRKKWYNRMKSFGFTEPTGVDLIGEALPELKNPKNKDKWYGTTIPWMAHGYELLNTPLQMLTFYNAVANGGKMMKPFLVKEIIKGEKVKIFEPVVIKEAIAKPENIAAAKKMMENVILKGTAKSIKSEYVHLAGKTGTTRVNYANAGEYAKYNASFCGYFPAENPEYTVMVVVYEPKGVYYGGYVAAPIFKEVAEKIIGLKTKSIRSISDSTFVNNTSLPNKSIGFREDIENVFAYTNVPYTVKNKSKWSEADPSGSKMMVSAKSVKNKVIPNCMGMGARDATYLLESLGLSVDFHGVGKVLRQSITPGTRASQQNITLYLH
ncbi:MAG: transpeptidase family protein [Saprospiraceae bacterium]|nr:transpeptidase family protein [Saprospiraceae bacterium]